MNQRHVPGQTPSCAITVHVTPRVFEGLVSRARTAGMTESAYAGLLFHAAYAVRVGKAAGDAELTAAVDRVVARLEAVRSRPAPTPAVDIVRPCDGDAETKEGPFARRTQLGYPPLGWTCFHCGETFTTRGAAEDHFGCSPNDDPACRIKVGDERGLVKALRAAEAEIRRLCSEDADYQRHIAAAENALQPPPATPAAPEPLAVHISGSQPITEEASEHLATLIGAVVTKFAIAEPGRSPSRARSALNRSIRALAACGNDADEIAAELGCSVADIVEAFGSET